MKNHLVICQSTPVIRGGFPFKLKNHTDKHIFWAALFGA